MQYVHALYTARIGEAYCGVRCRIAAVFNVVFEREKRWRIKQRTKREFLLTPVVEKCRYRRDFSLKSSSPGVALHAPLS